MIRFCNRFFSISNPKVYMEITSGTTIEGKLIFEIKKDIVPKTSANFLDIIQETSSVLTPKNKKLSYKNSKIHRIVPGFLCQGGDITNLNGKGGWSIYGESFEDENFTLKHDSFGTLSMANQGPNTNSSQFFITFEKCPMLDGKHTVFGKLIEGESVLRNIEKLGTANGKPRIKVFISDCGLVTENQ